MQPRTATLRPVSQSEVKASPLVRRWLIFLGIAIVIGGVLRLVWPSDLEFGGDQVYTFARVMYIGQSEGWPGLGMPSGVSLRNPGMSVWVFVPLAKLFHVASPIGLVQTVALLGILALVLLAIYAIRFVPVSEREPWLWAVALVAVNPFEVYYQRKIWAQSMLPIFCVLFLMCWSRRSKAWGAFLLGLIGISLGQIHLSGFFFVPALFLWALLFDRKSMRWKALIAGCAVSAIAMIPFFLYLRTPHPKAVGHGLIEMFKLKFWCYWVTDPFGFHQGDALVNYVGHWRWTSLTPIAGYLPYPLVSGHPTYLVAVAYALVAMVAFLVFVMSIAATIRGLRRAWPNLSTTMVVDWISGRRTQTGLLVHAAIFGFGALLTADGVFVFRHYLIVAYPLYIVWLTRLTLWSAGRSAKYALAVLFVAELTLSATFLGFIHANGGAADGDYGVAYHLHPISPTDWPVQVDKPGAYRVELTYSMDKSLGNNFLIHEMTVEAGQKSTSFVIPVTKSWTDYTTLATAPLQIDQPGETVIKVHTRDRSANYVMHLKSVDLLRVGEP